jgi:AraC family transcriptional regulator of arabinose operon
MKRMQTPDAGRPRVVVEILFVQQAVIKRSHQTTWHRHLYWQVELILTGYQHVRFPGTSRKLRRGDTVLIPIDSMHIFEYPYSDTETCTLKFSVRGLEGAMEPKVIVPGAESERIRESLLALVTKKEPIPEGAIRTAEHLLAALIDLTYCPPGTGGPETELVRSVHDYLDVQRGRPASVADIARRVGYSRSRLSEIFRRQAGVTLKEYIDEHRAGVAEALLRYSDYNASRIADIMGFPNLFAFSRFFKRMRGKSPRDFRKSILPPEAEG